MQVAGDQDLRTKEQQEVPPELPAGQRVWVLRLLLIVYHPWIWEDD